VAEHRELKTPGHLMKGSRFPIDGCCIGAFPDLPAYLPAYLNERASHIIDRKRSRGSMRQRRGLALG
jgi:hypothetical protein